MPIPVAVSSTLTPTVVAPNSLTVGEIVQRVERQFGDEANIQIQDADIIRWVNDAQRELALSNNLLQARAVTGVTRGVGDVSLPTDLLTLRSVRYNGVKLQPMEAREAEEYISDTSETGTPQRFWTYANTLTLYPAPDDTVSGALAIFYTRQPSVAVDTASIPDLPVQYHSRIVEYCLQRAYELDENWQAAEVKGRQYKDGVDSLKDLDIVTDFYPTITSLPEGW